MSEREQSVIQRGCFIFHISKKKYEENEWNKIRPENSELSFSEEKKKPNKQWLIWQRESKRILSFQRPKKKI